MEHFSSIAGRESVNSVLDYWTIYWTTGLTIHTIELSVFLVFAASMIPIPTITINAYMEHCNCVNFEFKVAGSRKAFSRWTASVTYLLIIHS